MVYFEINILGGILMKAFKKRMFSLLMVAVLAFSVSGVSASAATIKKPTVKSVTAKSATSITVKWGKISGAKGYVIYQKMGNKSFKKIATVTPGSKTSYTAKSLKSNTKYSYKIKSFTVKKGKKVYSKYSNVKYAYTKKPHVHNYVNYVCSCGQVDKWGAYNYLEQWLFENGEYDGDSFNYWDSYSNASYGLCYNEKYDYLYISTGWYNSYDDFVFTSINLDDYEFFHCIGGNVSDDYYTGTINATTFKRNTYLPCKDYNSTYYYILDDSAQDDVCDLLNWFDEFLYENNIGISIYELGFLAY